MGGSEMEVRVQRNEAAQEGGAEGSEAAGGYEVGVDLPEVAPGGGAGDEGMDGGRERGHAMEVLELDACSLASGGGG